MQRLGRNEWVVSLLVANGCGVAVSGKHDRAVCKRVETMSDACREDLKISVGKV